MNLFSGRHQAFRATTREFIDSQLTPNVGQWEREKTFPVDLFPRLARQGLLGMGYSSQFGGQELDFGFDIVLVEELTRTRAAGLVLSIIAQNHFFLPLLSEHGTPSQREEFLAPAIRGEKIGALASTEPSGGTDIVNQIACEAIEDGDHWIITGEKKYITNSPIADFVVALVRTRNEPTPTSLSLVIVPTTTAGFVVREVLDTLGLFTSPTGWIAFEECRVPRSLTLGKLNLGFFYLSKIFLLERLIGSVAAIALAKLALEDTITYLRARVAFRQPLSRMQVIRHQVSEMAAELTMAERFVHSVCESYRDGSVEAKEICMIKFLVPEMVQRIIHRCLQLHGAKGFLEENWLARAYRDARFLTVGGGATEAMKDLVASYLRL